MLLPGGVLLTLVLFTLLSILTRPPEGGMNSKTSAPVFDFLLLRQETDIDILSRQRPPEPEELPPLDTFEPLVNAQVEAQQVDLVDVEFDLPDIEIGLSIDMSPVSTGLPNFDQPTQMFAVDIPFEENLKTIKDVHPRYPSRALRRNIEGLLVVEFMIDPEGFVLEDSIKFIESNPAGVFEHVVTRSLNRSRFEPMKRGDQAVTYRAKKTYSFKMP